jgi:ribosomal protein S18 acetylase RimI-like enzyme
LIDRFCASVYQESDFDNVLALYSDAGWNAYTQKAENLRRGLSKSLDVLLVWEQEVIVGIIRTIGDEETIIYIQDLIVKKSHQRKGIGSFLCRKILAKYTQVRQLILLTEDNAKNRAFYESLGLVSQDKGEGVAFSRE